MQFGKSDMSAAFRNLGIKMEHWKYLIMKARNPKDGKMYYFVDKCLPFGAAISCSHFQRFSNAIAHLVTYRTNKPLVNYLDDFLFVALLAFMCNMQIDAFLEICQLIRFPVSLEKTFRVMTQLVFLGLLIDSELQLVLIPKEKIEKGKELVNKILNNKSRKVTVKDLQKLTGYLNFLGRAIVPGQAFTRRLYAFARGTLKPHHHVRVNAEMQRDLTMWLQFLCQPTIYSHPFLDFNEIRANEVDMFSDASASAILGMGATCQSSWMFKQWNYDFIKQYEPSIEYLELYALVAGVLTWSTSFRNRRIILFCNNQSVVEMINATSSRYKNCMVLIRKFVLHTLTENVRIYAKHVRGVDNFYSDSLSRLKIQHFWDLASRNNKKFEETPTEIPAELWPMESIWIK